MSFYSFGKIELEVIEPLRGRSCWRNYLSKTGGGIHHFLFNVQTLFDILRGASGWKLLFYASDMSAMSSSSKVNS